MSELLQVRNLVKRFESGGGWLGGCLLYTSPSPRDS